MTQTDQTGIIMKNITERVKTSADKIAEFDNECDGLIHIVKKVP